MLVDGDCKGRSCDIVESGFKNTLQQIIDRLKDEKMNVQNDQGVVRKYFYKHLSPCR